MSHKFKRGDRVLKIDGEDVDESGAGLTKMLIGSDVPGTDVTVTVKREGDNVFDVTLTRATTLELADKKKMFQLFAQIKDLAHQREDKGPNDSQNADDSIASSSDVGGSTARILPLVDAAVDLWTRMFEAVVTHDEMIAANVSGLMRAVDEDVCALDTQLQSLRDNARSAVTGAATLAEHHAASVAEGVDKEKRIALLEEGLREQQQQQAQMKADASRQLVELREEAQALRVKKDLLLAQLEKDLLATTGSLETATHALDAEKRAHASLRAEHEARASVMARLEAEAKHMSQRFSALQQEHEALKAEHLLLTAAHSTCEGIVAQLRAQLAELEGRNDELQRSHSEMSKAHSSCAPKIAVLETELAEVRSKLAATVREQAALHREHTALTAQYASCEAARSSLATHEQELDGIISAKNEEISALQTQQHQSEIAANAQIFALQREVRQGAQEMQAITLQVERKEDACKRLEACWQEAKDRNISLGEVVAAREAEIQALNAKLTEQQLVYDLLFAEQVLCERPPACRAAREREGQRRKR